MKQTMKWLLGVGILTVPFLLWGIFYFWCDQNGIIDRFLNQISYYCETK